MAVKIAALATAALIVAPLGGALPVSGGGADSPMVLSGPSPFASCEAGLPDEPVAPDTELEPALAVDPSNPDQMVVAWQQDRLDRGHARGIVQSVTSDGGASWSSTPAEGMSSCSGGTHGRTGSPWLSFGPEGAVHLVAGSLDPPLVSSVLVSRSADGGQSWAPPVSVIDDEDGEYWNDKPTVTADPTNPRLVYVTWNRGHIPTSRHQVMVARSVDGGRTYQPPEEIYQPTPDGAGTIGSQIVVLPGGALLHMFLETEFALSGTPPEIQSKVQVMRSTDRGRTWSGPVTVVEHTLNQPVLPDTGGHVSANGIVPDVAVHPRTGAVYLVWGQAGMSPADSDVALAASFDGGRHFTRPVRVNRTPDGDPAGNGQAFLPAVDVAADGTVAVSYYDFRANTPDSGTPTDLWLATCRGPRCQAGAGWAERHLAGSFDLETALSWRGGPYLGSYVLLAHTRHRFVAAYTATTGDPANRQDIFTASVPIRAGR